MYYIYSVNYLISIKHSNDLFLNICRHILLQNFIPSQYNVAMKAIIYQHDVNSFYDNDWMDYFFEVIDTRLTVEFLQN